MQPKPINILTIQFANEISQREIPLFRGAVIKSLGNNAHLLFHNHIGNDTFRYSYPLIQYKRIRGKASLVCIGEAANIIGQFLAQCSCTLKIGDREEEINKSHLYPARLFIQTWANLFDYHISYWIPLNSNNYHLFQNLESLIEKTVFLENILKGNLLSMLKGLDIHLENELIVKITHLSEPYILYNKGVGMTAFNADFKCNLTIPNNVGIGKNASIGFGVVHQNKNETT